ncbi:MAG: hypothetical protein QXG27_06485 [Candidatus Bathyarchaeia archaeon]
MNAKHLKPLLVALSIVAVLNLTITLHPVKARTATVLGYYPN